MSEPKNPPSKKEVKASGAADWVQDALQTHSRQQEKLAGFFGDAQEELRKQKEAVSQAWSTPVGHGEDEDRGPDLFASERAKVDQQKKALSSVWDQDKAERDAEQEQLRNLFGGGGPSRPAPKKPKR
jgi:hypothetical protein